MRTIHLIDNLDGETAGPTLGLLRDLITATTSAQVEHHILVLGPRSLCAKLEAVGVSVDEHLPCRGGHGSHCGADISAWWALRRWIKGGGLTNASDAQTIIHAWSLRGAGLAEALTGGNQMIVTLRSPARTFGEGTEKCCPSRRLGGRWMRAWRGGQSVCWALSGEAADWATSLGVAPSRLETLGPVIDPQWMEGVDREAMRRKLGVTDSIAVALLGDAPAECDVMTAYSSLLLVEGAGLPIKLVVAQGGSGLDRALHVMRGQEHSRSIIVADEMDRPWEALAGCDLGLHLGGTISLGWAMAGGLGIVSTGKDGADAWIESGVSGMIVEDRPAGAAARQLMVLAEDKNLAAQLGAGAREVALREMANEDWGNRMLQIYQRVAQGASV